MPDAVFVIGREDVVRHLDHASCIRLMRSAMVALSAGHSQQLLRRIIDLGAGNAFGVMPGALDGAGFGAKLVSVFPAEARSHQGAILLFDRETGAPICVVDAGEVTAIRTACASAVATDVLARRDAVRLAIIGTGEQAWQHALAIPHVRSISHISLWGRTTEKAAALAGRIAEKLGIAAEVADSPASAARGADIICTTTAATEPILFSRDVADGTHLNIVGSSRAGPVEIDNALVARSHFVPDHRDGVLEQGAEYLRARDAGLVTEAHVLPEIGHILAGNAIGRTGPKDVTLYKSLGSIVQDIACAAYLRDICCPAR